MTLQHMKQEKLQNLQTLRRSKINSELKRRTKLHRYADEMESFTFYDRRSTAAGEISSKVVSGASNQ